MIYTLDKLAKMFKIPTTDTFNDASEAYSTAYNDRFNELTEELENTNNDLIELINRINRICLKLYHRLELIGYKDVELDKLLTSINVPDKMYEQLITNLDIFNNIYKLFYKAMIKIKYEISKGNTDIPFLIRGDDYDYTIKKYERQIDILEKRIKNLHNYIMELKKRDEPISEEEAEEMAQEYAAEIESKEMGHYYKQHISAAESAIEHEFEMVNLKLIKVSDDNYEIESDDWNEAASKIIDIINGVGMFSFNSIEEFINDTSSDDARDAVLKHIHHIPMRAAVYGDTSALRRYERSL